MTMSSFFGELTRYSEPSRIWRTLGYQIDQHETVRYLAQAIFDGDASHCFSPDGVG
jgi:hypothetical protein